MDIQDLERYNFVLPKELIRSTGVEPRDSAKLLVYNTATNTLTHDIFRNIATHLPPKSLLVFNETKVLPARLWLTKETGGKIEVFVLINEWRKDITRIPVQVDRKLIVGSKLFCGEEPFFFTVADQKEERFFLELHTEEEKSLEEILLAYGSTPIPPYLKENTQEESALRDRYQTVFAKGGSSVAAPTASLHFTNELLSTLQRQGIRTEKLSLEVGLGTFAPLTEKSFQEGILHTEYVSYSQSLFTTLAEDLFCIAVGTTSLRALETISAQGITQPGVYATDVFITPGFSFQKTQGLITNFHTPKSSLLLLVDAFLQEKKAKMSIRELYQEAIKHSYAFYSFGDAMLIL